MEVPAGPTSYVFPSSCVFNSSIILPSETVSSASETSGIQKLVSVIARMMSNRLHSLFESGSFTSPFKTFGMRGEKGCILVRSREFGVRSVGSEIKQRVGKLCGNNLMLQ